MILKKEKIFVGMSGGVDSSVSAYLLKEEGYEVTGVFIKAWHPDFIPCNWKQEMRDAMRACAKLGIPFLMCDLEQDYKKNVIDYLVNEYTKGKTPNPDVLCNKTIKFGGYLKWAMKNGADKVATGHYAVKKFSEINGTGKKFNLMLKSEDSQKDQTYFLWTLTEEQLGKIEFPIGHLNKKEVRRIAKKINLNTAEKKDSQGLCFLGQVNMKNFLRRYIKTTSGDVFDLKGKIVGKHDGAELYTIGERHGINIFQKDQQEKPFYIVSKDISKNIVVVDHIHDTSDTEKINNDLTELQLIDVNLLPNIDFYKNDLEKGLDLEIKIRHRGEYHPVKLYLKDKTFYLSNFSKKVKVAEGQSVVFYKENMCIGGGVADSHNKIVVI